MILAELVHWYPPFSHYRIADFLRCIIAAAAVVTCLPVLLVAHRRRMEDRRSACLFLVGTAIALVGDVAIGSVISVGRPPVWWVIAARYLFVLVTVAACRVIPGEAERGVWARRS